MYRLVCSDSGRFYIGMTDDVDRRYREHARRPPPKMAEDCKNFKPFDKHFIIQVLEDGLSRAQALRREAHYISVLRSTSHPGYNEAPGTTTAAFWRRLRGGTLYSKKRMSLN